MLATSATNTSTGNLETQTANKPRLYSVGGIYRNGPLTIGAAYEQHNDLSPAGTRYDEDKGWSLSAPAT